MATVGVIQMTSRECIEDNWRQIESGMLALSTQDATLAVTPENCLLFASGDDYRALATQTADIERRCRVLCQRYKMGLLLGSVPTPAADGRLHTTSWLFDADGRRLGEYHKLHLFDVDVADGFGQYRESDTYAPGDNLVCVDSPWGRIGMTICYDVRFPALYQSLSEQGAEVLVVAAAFTAVTGQAHWQALLQARAIENQCWVIAAAQCGEHTEQRETWGHSMIIDPWGRIIAQLGAQPGVLSATINTNINKQLATDMPVKQHRRFSHTLDQE